MARPIHMNTQEEAMVLVRDIMQTDIVTVPLDMNVRQLARKLADGIVTAIDVLRAVAEGNLLR